MAFPPISPLTVDGLTKFLSFSYHRMIEWAVMAFVDLKLADRLIHAPPDRGGFTVEEIIGDDQSTWNKEMLYRILQPCIDAGLVKRVNDDQHFVLTEPGAMLTMDHPSHARDLIGFFFGSECNSAADKLANLVRGEGSSGIALVFGVDFYTLFERPDRKQELDTFMGALTAFSKYTGDKLISAVDFGRFETLVDHGGNRGTFLAEILHYYPSIKQGIIFDLPPIINEVNEGEDFQSHHISKDRYTFIAGNMFDASTIPQADADILKRILHNNNDEKAIEVLSSIRQVNQGSTRKTITVFIVEHVILADGAVSNWQSHGMDLVMAAYCGSAKERTQEEYQQLLVKSGFKFKTLYPVEAPDSIIEGEADNY